MSLAPSSRPVTPSAAQRPVAASEVVSAAARAIPSPQMARPVDATLLGLGALSRAGLVVLPVAALWIAVAILLSLAVQSAGTGMPTLLQLLLTLLAQALTMTLLVIGVVRLLGFLRIDIAPNLLLVPILYVLAYAFIIGIPLTLLGPLALLVPLALVGLIWRAGMVMAAMSGLAALAVALLCVIVLVVVPNALYMLLLLIPSA